MQSDINSGSGRFAVATEQPKERIKRRGRVRIQERLPQANLADLAYGQILPLVPGITEPSFPVPSLEIIAEFSHLAASPTSKRLSQYVNFSLLLAVSLMPRNRTPVVREIGSVNNHSRISDCERIKRIRDWDTDAGGTKAHVKAWDLKRI